MIPLGSMRCHASAALALLASTAFAADWPMHRGGPEMRGIASFQAPAKIALKWTFTAGKPVKAAAAIAQGRVFFGDDAGIVHALDLASGKWEDRGVATTARSGC